MNCDHLNRDKIITEWFFDDWIGDKSHLPESKDVYMFMKIVLDVVSVFGKINEQKRKYIIGRAAILGATEEVLNTLETYQSNSFDDINKLFKILEQSYVKKTRMGILYNTFRMLNIDNKICSEDLDIIYIIAEKLGVTKEQVKQIQDLHQEEEKLRQKRASLLFPHGFNDALMEYQKFH